MTNSMLAATLILCAIPFYPAQAENLPVADVRVPVLVELFTSEGCSSCPPADRLLQELDRQLIAGEEIIVLSEHVDYWNHIGWKDPYSAHFYSERQSAYAERFGLNGVYTPQMVVDGSSEFVGSDSGLAEKAIKKAAATAKIPVRLSSISIDPSRTLHARVEIGVGAASTSFRNAEIYVAIALTRAESQVSGGENAGSRLAHVSVVRILEQVGTIKPGEEFKKDVQVRLHPVANTANLRLVAFIQEPKQGKILGAAMEPVSGDSKKSTLASRD